MMRYDRLFRRLDVVVLAEHRQLLDECRFLFVGECVLTDKADTYSPEVSFLFWVMSTDGRLVATLLDFTAGPAVAIGDDKVIANVVEFIRLPFVVFGKHVDVAI